MYGTKFMRKLAVEIRSVLAIALPYFRSDERWSARILLGAVVALQLGGVGLTVAINAWNNAFYNALQEKDWGAFLNQLLIFCGLAAAYIIVKVYQLYLSQWLQIRWRRWTTDRYLDAWLSRKAHYRMHLLGQTADNPDQRISDDVHLFVSRTLNIGIELLGSVVSLASFAIVLWGLSRTVPLTIFGHSVAVPGYLVWGALFYAVLGTFVTHLIGRSLVRLNFDQQRYEADFRFALVRLRENSEEVALLGGEQAEISRLRDRFARVAGNWYAIMSRQKQLTFFTAGYDQVATVFPYLVVSPLYFAGAMQLGGLMQTASAFSQVQTSLSFFVTAYGTLAEWKAVVERLVGFEHAIAAAHGTGAVRPGIEIQAGNGEALTVRDLVVMLPSGAELVSVPTLMVAPGDRVLISGPSSSGKSSLMRSLGGIWPFGAGQIEVPPGTRLLALPQRAYLPLGTLRGALAYPESEDAYPDEQVRDALVASGLGHFAYRLDWLLLDEATSALDEPSEAALYRMLVERLPETGSISVGHRSGLMAFHGRHMVVQGAEARPWRLVEPGAAVLA